MGYSDKSRSNIWVCSVCGTPEDRWCKHKDTKQYSLITKCNYKAVRKAMGKAKNKLVQTEYIPEIEEIEEVEI